MAATARLAGRTFTATSPASRESAIREFLRATGRLTSTSGATPAPAAERGPGSPEQPASSDVTSPGQAASSAATAPQADAAVGSLPAGNLPAGNQPAGNPPIGNLPVAADAAAGRNQTVQPSPRGTAPAGSAQTFSATHTAPSGPSASSGSSDAASTDSPPSDRTRQSGSAGDRPIAPASTSIGTAAPDLADSADLLMNQVVKTIHSYQTTNGPALEAHISDPILGDVKLTVTGQAGEIVQAQLVVGNRASADALLTAAARSHASGEALTGVNVSVRSESGESWNSNGRSGSNAADSMTWGQGTNSHAGPGDGSGRSGDAGTLSTAGNGASGHGPGTGPSTGGAPGSERSSTASARSSAATVRQPNSRPQRSGGSSLDIRA
jgi:hypothetical protein